MQTRMKTWIGAIVATVSLFGSSFSFAEDDQPLTQGEAAILLAQRLHLAGSSVAPRTAQEAITVMMQNGISPFDKWDESAPLLVKDLAKILVEALGKSHEVAGKGGEEPTAEDYSDYLTREHGLDLSSIAAAISDVSSMARPEGTEVSEDQATTDPLKDRTTGGPDETTAGTQAGVLPEVDFLSLPVTAEVIQTVVRNRRGGGGAAEEDDDDGGPTTANIPQNNT